MLESVGKSQETESANERVPVPADDRLPTPEEILATHEEIEEAYDMKYRGTRVVAPKIDLRDILEEVVEYDTVYLRAAGLLRKLITAHLFEDGNKRTAWTAMREYLNRHNREPAVQREEVGRVLRRVRRFAVSEIAEWLESGDLDRSRLHP